MHLYVIVGKVLDPHGSVPQLLNQLVVPGLYCVVGISAVDVLSNIYPVLTVCQALLQSGVMTSLLLSPRCGQLHSEPRVGLVGQEVES